MPTVAELETDLEHLLTPLLSNEVPNPSIINSAVDKFLSIYDPLRTNEVWMSQHSSILGSTKLVYALVCHYEVFQAKQFLRLLHFCASLSTQDVALLFRDGQASCEVLQTMDQSLQNPEILTLGAKVLGLAAGSHSNFRAEIATGDGVSLFVEAMKSHSEDVMTLTALFVAMVNICYSNKDNKNTFVQCDGLDVFHSTFVLCNTLRDQLEEKRARANGEGQANGHEVALESPRSDSSSDASPRASADLVTTEVQLDHLAAATLALLRNLAPLIPKEKFSAPLIRSLLHFIRVSLDGKPALIASALTCVGSLIATSPTAKTNFVTRWNGIEELKRLWPIYASNARVMQPMTVILQLLSKVNANRLLISQEFLPLLHQQLAHEHTREPGVLHATVAVMYQLTFNSKTRAHVASLNEIMKSLLAGLQTNMPSPRLHALSSKLLIRLCAIDSCKRQIQAEGGITAILTPMNAYSGDTRVTKFLAQLVNIVLTNSSPVPVAQRPPSDSDSDSDSSSDSSDSSDSSSSDSDSDHSDSSDDIPTLKQNNTPTKPTPPPSPSALPILNAMDLDAAIAELEASTQMKKVVPTTTIRATGTPKKKEPKRTSSGNLEPPRASTPIDHSIDDLNALAQQLIDTNIESSPPRSNAQTSHSPVESSPPQFHIIQELEAEVTRLRAQLSSQTEAIEQLKREKAELDKRSSTDDPSQLREALSLSQQQQEALKTSAHALELQLEKTKASEQNAISELESLRQGIKAENEAMESQLSALSASLTALQAQNSAGQAQEANSKTELEKLNAALKEQLQVAQSDLTQARTASDAELEKLKLEMEKMRQALDLGAASSSASASAVSELKESLARAQKEKESMSEEIQGLQRRSADLAQNLAQATSHAASVTAERNHSHGNSTTWNAPAEMVSSATKTLVTTSEKLPAEAKVQDASLAGQNAVSTTNQVFSQPAPSFSAPSVSSSSSATGGHADVSTRPLSSSHSSGHDSVVNTQAAQVTVTDEISNLDRVVSSLPNGDISEDQMMKEKGWIRQTEYLATVANLERKIEHLGVELEDALTHSLHFQILSIRLDYHSRSEPVPTIEAIRELLTTGKSSAIPSPSRPSQASSSSTASSSRQKPPSSSNTPLTGSAHQKTNSNASLSASEASQPSSTSEPGSPQNNAKKKRGLLG